MGGGVLNTATKVATLGAKNAVSRGYQPTSVTENAYRSATHKVSPAIVSSSSDYPDYVKPPLQKPSREIGEWVLGRDEKEMKLDHDPSPRNRIIFGGPPSLQEAKAAIASLKNVLEEVYGSWMRSTDFSIPSTGKPFITEEPYCQPQNLATEVLKLLNEDPLAKETVISLVNDPNHYQAVIQNPKFIEYSRVKQNVSSEEPLHATKPGRMEKLKSLIVDILSIVWKWVKNTTSRVHIRYMSSSNGKPGLMGKIKSSIASTMCSAWDWAKSATRSVTGKVADFAQSYEGKVLMALAVIVTIVVLFKRSPV